MNKLTRHLLLAAIMMALGGTALAADPPKDPPKDAKDAKDAKDSKDGKDAKKEEAKADEPDLPSKPYPKNAVPKAFQPKKDETKEAAAKPEAAPAPAADKAAAKPAPVAAEKAPEKHAEKAVDKTFDKPMVKLPTADKLDAAHDRPIIVASPKKRKPARPAPVAAANASLPQLAHESARKTALSNEQEAYVAQSGDTLDKVIKKTFPSSPFSNDVMREAFVRANPKMVSTKNIKLKPGQVVNLPDVNVMRMVVMGEGTGPATMAVSGEVHYDKKPMIHVPASTAPAAIAPAAAVVSPPIAIPRLPVSVASNNAPANEVSLEEKKKWVRYP